MIRKQKSRNENRKIKKRKDEIVKSQQGSIHKLFNAKSQNSTPLSQVEEVNDDYTDEVIEERIVQEDDIQSNEPMEGNNEQINEEGDDGIEIMLDLEKDVDVNYDPGLWGEINDAKRVMLVERGPIKILKKNDEFPRDKDKIDSRSFSSKYYVCHQPNGEIRERKWLVYSNELNKAFCFCCKLFKHKPMRSNFANDGVDDWHNIMAKIRDHESNPEHNANIVKWVDLQVGLKLNATVDKKMQSQIEKEKIRWRMVLIRIIGVVKVLSRNNLPFRGSNEKVYEKNNGLFCQLIECIAEFDAVMEEHLRRVVSKEIHYHYLSHKIQNELISLLADNIKNMILQKIIKARYFSIILDCTPDLSHEEQMSIIIRCVVVEERTKAKIEEFFLGFITVDDTSGLGLFKRLQEILIDLKLDVKNIRGQGYDNGSNMKGKNQGVQKRLLDINRRAVYVPCGCHSLNLALCDMAKSCNKARNFFAYVQKIYTLCSGSIQRWKIVTTKVSVLTPKPLSVTRWESHIDSVRAIRTQAPQLRDALIEIANETKEDVAMAEAKGLVKNALEDFGFLISLCVWYKVLDKINGISKMLQEEEMDLEDAIAKIKYLVTFFENFRTYGFEEMMKEGRELAIEIGIDPNFPPKKRVNRKKRFHDEIEDDVDESITPETNFKITFFIYIIDQALSSLNDRFEQFVKYEEKFGFLFIAKLRSVSDEDLLKHCHTLEEFLQDGEHHDVYANGLYEDLRELRQILPNEVTKGIDILNFIKSYWECGGLFENAFIAYRILLTIPVTVASAERSFSKLKLIKNYLRTTMSQERLSGLSMIAIEKELLDKLRYDEIIGEFASKNARRTVFL